MLDIESELNDLGYPVVAVSPDRPAKIRQTVIESDLTYGLYSDSTLAAARAFGIAWQAPQDLVDLYRRNGLDLEDASGLTHHQLPVPSVFLVRPGGKIGWVYSNPDYKVRPDNESLLEAARNQPS